MSKRVVYHVEPRDGGEWAAQRTGAQRAAIVTDNKTDAIAEARRLATQGPLGQVVIHGDDGKIQREYTYGKDPRNIPG